MILRGLLALFLLVGSPAFAASYQHSVLQVAISSGATFTGPGDIVSGATAWYGLRGYSGAVAATGTQKAINVRRQSDNTTSDILILTNGDLDVATAASFAGTDATCQGTIASTTLTCASASSTPVANDTVSGGGIVGPAYIVSCGTFTAGAGTCTLNAAQTVSVAETITMTVGLFVTKWYDQSGALACTGSTACDSVQATAGSQPQLVFSCLGSLSCLRFSGANFMANNSGTPVAAQPFSMSGVAIRTANFAASSAVIIEPTANEGVSFQAANTVRIASATALNGTASDSSWHAIQGVANGASSAINVDGTDTTGTAGATAPSSTLRVGGQSNAVAPLTGNITEAGIWSIAFASGDRTSMCHNQFVYWGTAASC